MPIKFSCDCGQALTVREEYAGKRVRCNACSEVVTVPGGGGSAVATAEVVRFECDDCGRAMQAKAVSAGKRVKCPGCEAIMVIPAGAGAGRRSASAAIQADAPRPRSRARDRDEDEDEFEERPAKRRKRQEEPRGFPWLWAGAGTAAALLVAAGIFFLFIKGKDDTASGPNADGGDKDKNNNAAADFDLVPRNAAAFGTMRVAELAKTTVGKKMLEAMAKQGNPLADMERETGLKIEQIDRATLVAVDLEGNVAYAVIHTNAAYDKGKILQSAGLGLREATHNGQKYHTGGREGTSYAFPSDKILIMGSEAGVKKCFELPKMPQKGPLDEALELCDGKVHVAGGFVMPNNAQTKELKEAAKLFSAGSLAEAKSVFVTASVSGKVEIKVGVELPDNGMAEKAHKELTDLLATAKVLLGPAMAELQREMGPAGAEIKAEVEKALGALKPDRDGVMVTLKHTVDGAAIDKALAGVGAGGGGGPREAAERAVALNNFAQVTLAIVNYCDQNRGVMPLNAIYHPQTGQPLLSWRVAILRELDEEGLYNQIRRNEPWNSPHNRQFWSKMPKCFDMPGLPASGGMTAIQVFTKDGPIYKPANPRGAAPNRFPAALADGPSQTICCAEAKVPVNWMEPRDLDVVNMANIMASLGNRTKSGPIVSFYDGSRRPLPLTISNNSLKALVTPAADDVPGPDAEAGGGGFPEPDRGPRIPPARDRGKDRPMRFDK